MGMNASTSGASVSEINVTPLIDVLLVLLIIFMVIVPVAPLGLEALVPRPAADSTPAAPPQTIVVELHTGPAGVPVYTINEQTTTRQQLSSRLRQIFATRAEKILFVKADRELEYSWVAEVIDMGKAARVENVGLLTAKLDQDR